MRTCPCCEGEVTGRANKKFCSRVCSRRARYQRAVARHRKPKAVTCPGCGTVHPGHYRRLYCTDECRKELSWKRVPTEKWKEYKARYRMNQARKAEGLEPIYSALRRKKRKIAIVEPENAAPVIPRARSMAEAQQHAGREVYG